MRLEDCRNIANIFSLTDVTRNFKNITKIIDAFAEFNGCFYDTNIGGHVMSFDYRENPQITLKVSKRGVKIYFKGGIYSQGGVLDLEQIDTQYLAYLSTELTFHDNKL